MQTVRSKEWRIAQELKEYLQDPEMLVIDEIARSEKASPHRNSSDWIIRALGNVDGRQRLHALMRDRETGKMFDAAYQRTGDEAFSRNNRPRIQFTSFRPFRRAAEPDGDQARYPEFQIGLQATFRLTYFK